MIGSSLFCLRQTFVKIIGIIEFTKGEEFMKSKYVSLLVIKPDKSNFLHKRMFKEYREH